MPAITTIIAAVGIAGTLAGTAIGFAQSKKQAKQQEKFQKLQKRRADLEALRQRRGILRQIAIQRGTALTSGANQGALGSSSLEGGLGNISATGAFALQGINQGQDLSNQEFAANRRFGQAATGAAIGQGLTSLGGGLIRNNQEIGRVISAF